MKIILGRISRFIDNILTPVSVSAKQAEIERDIRARDIQRKEILEHRNNLKLQISVLTMEIRELSNAILDEEGEIGGSPPSAWKKELRALKEERKALVEELG